MTNLTVRVVLSAPIALGRLPYAPTLDAVLASLIAGTEWLEGTEAAGLFDELGRCLAIHDGVPAASALWPLSTVSRANHEYVRSSVAQDLTHFGGNTTLLEHKGKWLMKRSTRATIYSRTWAWWAQGDQDAISGWLSRLSSVGAKRAGGFGAVDRVSINPTGRAAWRVHGIDDLVLSRPVPLDRLDWWLRDADASRNDLDWSQHAIIPLPQWPAPAWGPGPDVPTVVPLLPSEVPSA